MLSSFDPFLQSVNNGHNKQSGHWNAHLKRVETILDFLKPVGTASHHSVIVLLTPSPSSAVHNLSNMLFVNEPDNGGLQQARKDASWILLLVCTWFRPVLPVC
jgi:hypothetical protein